MINLFIIGVTGYIGGTILPLIDRSKYDIVALIRAKAKAEVCKKYNIKPVMGDLDSLDVISQYSYEADVVLNLADCDHLPSAEAVMQGLEKKLKETGKKTLYIHTR
jgi:putative NADH-flavin reductase